MKTFRSIPVQLSENFFSNPDQIDKEIQLLRVGKFFHEGQEIEVSKQDLKKMVQNYSDGVRKIDLMLDFSHESEKEAAAWFNNVYLSEDGNQLWATVEWTQGGEESVRKKEYRYISADFSFSYKDNETLKDHGPTLFGAGLTNRPVVKGMNPVILSENNNSEEKMPEGKNEDFKKKFEEMEKSMASKDAKIKELEEKISSTDKKLAEKEKEIQLAEKKKEEEKKLSEKKTSFDTMLTEGKAVEAQREAFMKDDMQEFIKNAGDVNLAEKGNGKTPESKKDEHKDSETPAQDEVISLSEKMAKEEKITFCEAQDKVLNENKELADKYNKEVNE